MSRRILIYRWIVFLLAAGYCLRTIFLSDYSNFGGPFRFLTIWALFGSFFAASRMLALTEGRSERRWDGFVGMISVVNAMVVFLYWRLFLEDPHSVTRDGELGQFYLELYLHALGPLLQWIDAIFIHRSFTRLRASALWLIGAICLYLTLGETLFQFMNDSPSGSVTSGIPYPFLNNMVLADRLTFYATNIAIALALLLVFAFIARMVRRLLPKQEAL